MTTDNGQGDSDDEGSSVTARILREQLEVIDSLFRTCQQIQVVLPAVSPRSRDGLLAELYDISREAADALHAFAVLVHDIRRSDGGGP